MITYSWEFPALDCYPEKDELQDVVFTVHWRYKGTDGTYSAETYGSLSVPLPNSENFIPYNELTKTDIESWVITQMGETGIQSLQTNISQQIEQLINPSQITKNPPWN